MTCKDCRFWRGVKADGGGLCCRYAPRASVVVSAPNHIPAPNNGDGDSYNVSGAPAVWPLTAGNFGCGDFQAMENVAK